MRLTEVAIDESSDLDWSKSLPTSLFHLPCQAQEPGDSFFQDYCGDDRHPLEPSNWLQNMTFHLQPGIEVLGKPEISPACVDEVLVQRTKEVWRGSKGQPGRGDEMFFKIACVLDRAAQPIAIRIV